MRYSVLYYVSACTRKRLHLTHNNPVVYQPDTTGLSNQITAVPGKETIQSIVWISIRYINKYIFRSFWIFKYSYLT